MLRAISFLLGFGLLGLWAAALGSEHPTVWLMWADFAAAVCAFAVPTIGRGRIPRRAGGADLALGVALFALFAIGVSGRATAWQSWWTLGFGCIYLLLGTAGIVVGETHRPRLERLA